MKSIKLIKLVIILALLLAAQQARAECSWSRVVTSGQTTQESSGCKNAYKKVDDSQCSAPKPADGFNTYSVCCCPDQTYTPPKPSEPKFVMPELQISIPGLTLSPTSSIKYEENSDGSRFYQFPWLSEYIIAVFNYGLGVAGILAAIVLMAGGILWLVSSGDASKITQSKELIIGSVTGLIILSCSYIILTQINPNLVQLNPISIGYITTIDLQPNPENTTEFSAKCVAQTTGPCAISNMSVFGERASQASAICNAESSGNPAIYNKLTKCTGGEYAVWGLFQFNLSANKFVDDKGQTLDCPKAFNKTWTNSKPTCTVINSELYNKCVTAATDGALSIKNAHRLASASKTHWGPWEANSKWCNFK